MPEEEWQEQLNATNARRDEAGKLVGTGNKLFDDFERETWEELEREEMPLG